MLLLLLMLLPLMMEDVADGEDAGGRDDDE